MTPLTESKTEVGNYFVSNYPPYSFWTPENLPALEDAFHSPAGDETLGLYLHIPFCRKRCKFCYFRVFTDKNSAEIERYIDAMTKELAAYRSLPTMQNRKLRFVYFGGGTPSYLSAKQLKSLVARLQEHVTWDNAEEVTFECEPGTLTAGKLEAIRDIGVTRLSLGIENFDDGVLEENGRAHRSAEVFTAYEEARRLKFDSINVDLIAGMVRETDENWKDCVRKVIDLAPDCVTIYQMELPYNTIYSKDVSADQSPVADWDQKRAWVDYAFSELENVGYRVSSTNTVVKDASVKFVYRDGLWNGAELLGIGVSSFGHIGGVHYQNLDGFDAYLDRVESGQHPWNRALPTTIRQRMIREFILQLKTGHCDADYFANKFALDPVEEFGETLKRYEDAGLLGVRGRSIELTRKGLLQVDGMLEAFFDPEHRNARYT